MICRKILNKFSAQVTLLDNLADYMTAAMRRSAEGWHHDSTFLKSTSEHIVLNFRDISSDSGQTYFADTLFSHLPQSLNEIRFSSSIGFHFHGVLSEIGQCKV